MHDILTAAQTAKVMGCAPQKVRERIKRKSWTFGVWIPKKETGHKKDDYEVNKYQLAAHLGIPVEEVDRRLGMGHGPDKA
jgi:hypothetical protein